jgi:hypothetical protein
MALLIAVVAPLSGQAPPVWAGTWQMAQETTSYTGPPAFIRATYVIEAEGDGLHVVYDAVMTRGGVTHLEWRGKLDGGERPVQGSDEYLTYAYRADSHDAWELTARVDGRIVATATVRFSADGREMTTVTRATVDGRPIVTTTVYRKRQAA